MLFRSDGQGTIDKGFFREDPMLGTIKMDFLLATAKEIAGGMAYLHSQDLMHGDLTASNIMLASSEKDRRHFAAKVSYCSGAFCDPSHGGMVR